MSELRFLPRWIVLFGIALTIAGCASAPAVDMGGGKPFGGPCSSPRGDANRQAPIVCVDDSSRTLVVSPDPVTVDDALSRDRKSPVMMHWFTRSGTGDLQVEIEPGCVAEAKCDGRGHCSARTMPGSTKSCKYDVWVTGKSERLDPTIVVTTCCG
jgi:hypothetical protein